MEHGPLTSWVFFFISFLLVDVSLNLGICSPFFDDDEVDSSHSHSKPLEEVAERDHFSFVGSSFFGWNDLGVVID